MLNLSIPFSFARKNTQMQSDKSTNLQNEMLNLYYLVKHSSSGWNSAVTQEKTFFLAKIHLYTNDLAIENVYQQIPYLV